MARWDRRLPLLLLLALAACAPAASGGAGPIVVPPPPTPTAEPTPLAITPSKTHVHAIALMPGGGWLVGTHTGVALAALGASPRPLGTGPRGDVLQVAMSGTAMLAAGHLLGVQVSRDRGATWAAVAPEVAGLDVHGLAVDPTDPRTVFAYAVGRGMLVSHDAGAHWTHLAGDADRSDFYLTGLAVTADGTLLAGSPQLGLAASTDRGAHFVSVYQGTGRVYSVAASATDPNIVFVAGDQGIFITQDGGKNWSAGQTSDVITGVGIDPADARHLLAGGSDGALFESHNGGDSWSLY